MAVKPGDAIPIADLDVRVVSSGGKVITRPLDGAGAPNPLRAAFLAKEEAPMLAGENGRSVGVVVISRSEADRRTYVASSTSATKAA